MSDHIGIAVVGAGYWGPNLVRNFAACPRTAVVWVCDRDLNRAARVQRMAPLSAVTDDFQAVLNDPAVDAVAIATPVSSHFPLAQAALQAGKHVLVEKPLATTAEEGRRLVSLAREKGRRLMCDHTFCYTGAVRKMQEIVRSGELGRLLYYDSVRVNLGLFQSDVNVLWDLCPHDLSIIDYVFPDGLQPTEVSAQGLDIMHTGFESVAHLCLFFGDDLMCHIHANWLSPVKVRTVLLGGTRKMIAWDDNNPAERLKVYDKGVDVNQATRERCLVNYRHGDAWIPVLDTAEALAAMVNEFAAAIQEERDPLTDGQAGLRVLEVLEAADRSLRQGGARVPVPRHG